MIFFSFLFSDVRALLFKKVILQRVYWLPIRSPLRPHLVAEVTFFYKFSPSAGWRRSTRQVSRQRAPPAPARSPPLLTFPPPPLHRPRTRAPSVPLLTESPAHSSLGGLGHIGAPREGEQARRPSSSRGRGCLRGVNDVRAGSTSSSIISPAGEISGRRAVARARRSGVRPPDPPRTRSCSPAYSPTVRTPPGPACAPPSHRPIAAFCARPPGLHAPLACREPAHPSHPFVR